MTTPMKRYTAMLFSMLLLITACTVDDTEKSSVAIHISVKEKMNEVEHFTELHSFLNQLYLPELSEDNLEPTHYSF